jgi:hypothetical protein
MAQNPDDRFLRTNQSFFMKWDTHDRKSKFNTHNTGPFTWRERSALSQSMTVRQILDTTEYKVRVTKIAEALTDL